jgi:hypothetical protein
MRMNYHYYHWTQSSALARIEALKMKEEFTDLSAEEKEELEELVDAFVAPSTAFIYDIF